MCTVIVSFEPGSAAPVLLVGVRDEFLARAWLPPSRHWPGRPGLIGGKDLLAGGTWLAADPGAPRVACILNGQGRRAPEATRLSRGELPLLLAGGESLDRIELPRFDPFHLVYADRERVRLSSWDSERLTERDLDPGLHLVVNSGLEGVGGLPDSHGYQEMLLRISHFRPRLLAADRPDPRPGRDDVTAAWGQWLPIVDGDGLDPADPRAMILRRDFGAGGPWGTSSVSLLALHRDGLRYDFIDRSGL